MLKKRLIPVLIIRDGQVVQSVRFKHTNVIHSMPATAVDFFNRWAVDEIVILDVSRNLSKRDKFYEVVSELSKKCFVPLSVGGWIDSLDEIKKLLRSGADKVVLNTIAVRQPEFVRESAELFGTQCVVVSMDVKKKQNGDGVLYEVYIDRGREATGLSPFGWAKRVQELGAGEIFLNCIDHDGYRKGYDLELLKGVVASVDIPVIAMGGVFNWQHLVDGIFIGGADAVAAANIFHYTEHSTKKAKAYMREKGLDVR